jgi:hypothetical protein
MIHDWRLAIGGGLAVNGEGHPPHFGEITWPPAQLVARSAGDVIKNIP